MSARRSVARRRAKVFGPGLVLVATSAKAVTPMPPELARTTWGWVSLTTPEETLTIAASPT
jgi:hypothetical protein